MAASREWLVNSLITSHANASARHAMLAGIAPANTTDNGRTVCTCFGIGEKQIVKAITDFECCSIASVGKHTTAGTNCGSCRSEISALVQKHKIEDTEAVPA